MNSQPPRIPEMFARVLSRLPQYPPSLALVAALNLALGRILPREPLEPLTGKRLAIRVTDLGTTATFTLGPRGFSACGGNIEPDVRISACARDFLLLAMRKEDPDTLFFDRRLLMEGDTDLGLLVKNTLDALEPPRLPAFPPFTQLQRLLERVVS